MISVLLLFLTILLVTTLIAVILLFTKVQALERDIRDIRGKLPGSLAAHVRGEPARGSSIQSESPVPSGPVAEGPPLLQPTTSGVVPLPPAPPAPGTPAAPSRTKEEWEALIGGKLLNRIGALALIIGVGFFLKYAFDRNWINETVRVLIGALIGGALLLGAARTHRKNFQIFAQGLVGAGIAILYLSVYASFNFYHLVPQLPAFALMTVVTAIAFAHAFRYDSLAVALLGWLGGFLTPFLLSTGTANELGLFTYLALLDAGILLIALRKTAWTPLEPLALSATWLMYVLWFAADYSSEAFSLTVYFVLVFWVLFHGASVIRVRKGETTFRGLRYITAAGNALCVYVALSSLIDPYAPGWTGGATLLFGLCYVATASFIYGRPHTSTGWFPLMSTIAALLVIIATAVQFSGFTTVGAWSVEALALALVGARRQWSHLSWLAFALLCAAMMKLTVTEGAFLPSGEEPLLPLVNRRGITYLLLAASAWASSGLYDHLKEKSSSIVSGILAYGTTLVTFLLLTVETIAQFHWLIQSAPLDQVRLLAFYELLALAAVWGTYGTLLTLPGVATNSRSLLVSGLIALLLSIFLAMIRGSSFDPVQEHTFVTNWRFAVLALIVAEGFIVRSRLARASVKGPSWVNLLAAIRILLVILLLILVTAETRDTFNRAIALATSAVDWRSHEEELNRLQNLQQLSLSGVWLIFSIVLMGMGIWRRVRGLRVISIVLFGLTIVKIFIYDLSFLDTLYRIFSFIGLGMILLAVSYAYQKYKGIIFGGEGEYPPSPLR